MCAAHQGAPEPRHHRAVRGYGDEVAWWQKVGMAEYWGQITMAFLGSVRGVVDVEDLIQDVAIRQRRSCCEIRPLSATRSQTSSVRRGMSK
jgi:hypothetical protein